MKPGPERKSDFESRSDFDGRDSAALDFVLERVREAAFVVDEHARIRHVNDAACAGLGYARNELLGLGVYDLAPELVSEGFAEYWAALRAQGSLVVHRRLKAKSGGVIGVELTAHFVWHEGRPYALELSTSLRAANGGEELPDSEVRRSRATYTLVRKVRRQLLRSRTPREITDSVCRIAVDDGGLRMAWVGMLNDETGVVSPVSSAGFVQGYLDAPIGGQRASREAEPAAAALFRGHYRICNDVERDPDLGEQREAALQRGYHSIAAFPLRSGARVVGSLSFCAAVPGFFGAEEVRLLDELSQDVAFALEECERQRAREHGVDQLRATEQLFRDLAESIHEVFWITEPPFGKTLYVSPAYERIWGRPRQEVYDRPATWADAIHPEDRERVLQGFAAIRKKGNHAEEYRIVRPDGSVRWLRDRATVVRTLDGNVVRVVGVVEDITERRLMAEQLRQSQKMDAVGQLAGGIAHDFNNIISGVIMQAELTQMVDDLPPAALEGLREIRAAADRAANLTRQLVLFSRRQVMQPQELDLNDSVANMAKMLQRIIGEDVRLQLRLSATPLITRADAGMLDQVLMNLAVNARDAMPGGGTLTLVTEERELDEAFALVHPDAAPGRYVCLTVTDTGVGIDPEVLPHIFEPFFTTKDPGRGAGLGLATVFGIVKQHGGSVAVDSAPNQGASFQVILPASQRPPDHAARALQPRPKGGNETILLVEDEPTVRSATRSILARYGYRVLEGANGVEALKLWEKHADTVALLLTDLVMPAGMSGHELSRRLQADRPDLKVIFTSGYSAEIAGQQLELGSGENFLAKPFQPSRLLEVLRRALDD